ncbi:unnamed protein product, partial [Schistosoma mattheei]
LEYDSLAAQCGQIINGDQILGINGNRIKSREHVIDLFQQSKKKVTLLIAREKCQTLKENNTIININSTITKTLNTIQSNTIKNESINEFYTNNELSISTINKNCTDYPNEAEIYELVPHRGITQLQLNSDDCPIIAL